MASVNPVRLRCEYLENPLAVQPERPRLSWIVESDRRGTLQTAYHIQVASSPEKSAADEGDLWDSGKVDSDQTLHVEYAGKPLASGQQAWWKVRVWSNHGEASAWSAPATWRMGILDKGDWKAKWIAAPGDLDRETPYPSPMFRKAFKLDKPIKRATAIASALGLYELRLNGQRVGDQLLAPEWTDYSTHVQYQAYDVTDLLVRGENAVGAMLGDGWYAGRLGISHIIAGGDSPLRAHYGKRLHFLLRMDIEFEDGSTQTVVTDDSWKFTAEGPVRKACILDGEVYDARKEINGWDAVGFDDAAWSEVMTVAVDEVKPKLVAQPNEPIRVTEELRPIAITEPAEGVYVVDFGQNMAGWVRLQVDAPEGTSIRLRHAEVLQEDGHIYRTNLRMEPLGHIHPGLGARQEDTYTCRGGGREVFEPHFTYHGYRYVEVVGLPGKPSKDAIVARVFHSAPAITGEFESSSDLFNQLMQNILWTQRSNLHSTPTDCPQRDERMGWTGDILAFAQTACFNMDMAAFLTKWLRDMRDDQAEDGRYPDFAPHPFDSNKRFSGVPAWGDAGVTVPWQLYLNYGDTRILDVHFESARRWVDWIHGHNPDLLWLNKRNNDYGDWLNGNTFNLQGHGFPEGVAEVPKDLLATAFWHNSTKLVAQMAELIDRKADAEKYRKLADDIEAAFVDAYIEGEGKVKGNTQAGYALALNFELVPEDQREQAARHMVDAVEHYKWHMSTGFHSTFRLMNELTRYSYNDVAYRLLNNRTIPSWGYSIEQGATTIWERWDGYVKGRGFQDPAMNSFNHYAIGSVGEWMYKTILGINPDEAHPAYKQFTLRPRPGGGLEWVRGGYDSIRGEIKSAWKIEGDTLTLNVSIPANTAAKVYVPAKNADLVTEGGKPAGEAEGVTFERMEGDFAVYTVGSGDYAFAAKGG